MNDDEPWWYTLATGLMMLAAFVCIAIGIYLAGR